MVDGHLRGKVYILGSLFPTEPMLLHFLYERSLSVLCYQFDLSVYYVTNHIYLKIARSYLAS